MKKKFPIIADLHTHTVASGHSYSTILEYAEYAKKAGLKYLAMTDHGPAMPGGPHIYFFENLKMVPDVLCGVNIIRGAEANIISSDGKLDIPERTIKNLDFVLFTFHPRCGYEDQGADKNTEVMISVMANPYVSAIAHLENPKFKVNYEAVVAEAHKRGILIEVNNSSYISRPGTRDESLKFLKEAKRIGAKVCLGTDAHICTMVGKFDYALGLVREAGIPIENIVNTSDKLLKQYVLNRGSS